MLEASGAPRGSLYHHFPGGKDELVLAAVRLAGDQALAALDRVSGQSAGDVARTFAALWRVVLSMSGFAAGCAVVAVTVATDSPALLESAAEVFRDWRSRLGAPPWRGPESAPMAADDSKLMIIITSDDHVYLGKDEITGDLDAKLKTNARLQTEKEVYIQGDENVRYGTVLRVMSAARSAGVEKLGMNTDPLTVK